MGLPLGLGATTHRGASMELGGGYEGMTSTEKVELAFRQWGDRNDPQQFFEWSRRTAGTDAPVPGAIRGVGEISETIGPSYRPGEDFGGGWLIGPGGTMVSNEANNDAAAGFLINIALAGIPAGVEAIQGAVRTANAVRVIGEMTAAEEIAAGLEGDFNLEPMEVVHEGPVWEADIAEMRASFHTGQEAEMIGYQQAEVNRGFLPRSSTTGIEFFESRARLGGMDYIYDAPSPASKWMMRLDGTWVEVHPGEYGPGGTLYWPETGPGSVQDVARGTRTIEQRWEPGMPFGDYSG